MGEDKNFLFENDGEMAKLWQGKWVRTSATPDVYVNPHGKRKWARLNKHTNAHSVDSTADVPRAAHAQRRTLFRTRGRKKHVAAVGSAPPPSHEAHSRLDNLNMRHTSEAETTRSTPGSTAHCRETVMDTAQHGSAFEADAATPTATGSDYQQLFQVTNGLRGLDSSQGRSSAAVPVGGRWGAGDTTRDTAPPTARQTMYQEGEEDYSVVGAGGGAHGTATASEEFIKEQRAWVVPQRVMPCLL